MTKNQLKEVLRDKQGYLKSGPHRLSLQFDIPKHLAKQAIREVKNEIRGGEAIHIDFIQSKLKDAEVAMSKQEALQFTATALISAGKIEEAIDLLTRVEKEVDKPSYTTSKFKDGNYVVLGCSHLPFHNKEMWTATCKLIADMEDLKGIVLAGDILDMHSISRHSKGKIRLPGYTLAREYNEANLALDELDAAIGDRKIIKEYFYGDNADWYNK